MFQVGLQRYLLSSFFLLSLFALASSALAQQDAKPASIYPTTSGQAAPANTTAPAVDPLKRPITEKQKKENSKSLKQELSKTYKKWLDEDVVYIISDSERKAFKQLSNNEERDQFIESFWQRRNPNPDSEDNEFKDEHYRRIAYANEHFAAGKPGWLTDRGHIYIAWGPPDEKEEHPSGGAYDRPLSEGGGTTQTYPYENWTYRFLEGIGNNVNIEFVDTCMCGDFHMTLDRSEKDALLHV